MKIKKTILGIMSGTSLDGLDFALCEFEKSGNNYSYKIIKTDFFEYDNVIKKQLETAQNLNSYNFIKFHKEYGKFMGQKANVFLKNKPKPDFIASHGHTVFHKPEEQVTFQIGDGAFIAAETGIPVISDFRNLDTALGGQGAPLVPVGDKLLFHEYDYCINLGGFANISYDVEGIRTAFDICPFNFIINKFAQLEGKEYDKDGELGKSGNINKQLLDELNNIDYYKFSPPKSLAREYVENFYLPVFSKYKISNEDVIRTVYEHSAFQINNCISPDKKVLVTGGGAHNKFFISLLKKNIKNDFIIPDKELIDFKEAIIFAFLGFLRSIGEINTLASVTGAKKDSSGGNICYSAC
ncbi:MAG: anhydro-N-acetylmuramic acid kinase [Bacteroidales bacterium]|nr:anhydro-N-acetylmuramic acid kinase [Bacteroidales bacterium]